MNPWDELEQRFLRFTTTVKEMVDSIMLSVDDDRVSAEIADNVSNLAVGLKQYVITCEDEIASAMESKIAHDYSKNPFQQTTGVLVIDENYTVRLPQYVIDLLGWKPGDNLQWEIGSDNTATIRNLDK